MAFSSQPGVARPGAFAPGTVGAASDGGGSLLALDAIFESVDALSVTLTEVDNSPDLTATIDSTAAVEVMLATVQQALSATITDADSLTVDLFNGVISLKKTRIAHGDTLTATLTQALPLAATITDADALTATPDLVELSLAVTLDEVTTVEASPDTVYKALAATIESAESVSVSVEQLVRALDATIDSADELTVTLTTDPIPVALEVSIDSTASVVVELANSPIALAAMINNTETVEADLLRLVLLTATITEAESMDLWLARLRFQRDSRLLHLADLVDRSRPTKHLRERVLERETLSVTLEAA